MKLKSTSLFPLIIAFVVAVAGCSSDNNGEGIENENNSLPQASQQEQNTYQEQDTSLVKGSLQNPAGVGETVLISSAEKAFEVTATEVIRGTQANSIIQASTPTYGIPNNDLTYEPAEGNEYLLVNMNVTYIQGSESINCKISDFTIFCNGIEGQSWLFDLPESYIIFSNGGLIPGGIKEGWLVYEVPQNSDVIMGCQPDELNPIGIAYISLGK